jgi:lipid-binding SYLF domain-containing protein
MRMTRTFAVVWLAASTVAGTPRVAPAHHWVSGVAHGDEHAQAATPPPGTGPPAVSLPQPQAPPAAESSGPSPGASAAPNAPVDAGDAGADSSAFEWQSEDVGAQSPAHERTVARIEWAAEAYEDLTTAADHEIPEALLAQTRCIAVIPQVVKGAFFFGARYGKGVLTCRKEEGGAWSAPVFVTLAGPSVGFQWGAQSADVVLFFRRESGVRRLLESRLTLGADASIAAGPVGRRASAEVDVTLATDILSYARSRGVFLGVSLEGSYLGVDDEAVTAYYGRDVEAEALLFGTDLPPVPASANRLLAQLPR